MWGMRGMFRPELLAIYVRALSPVGVEDKRWTVRDTHEPGACVRAVAARHNVYPSLFHDWRRQMRKRSADGGTKTCAGASNGSAVVCG
jgi:transposase-like protein